MIPSDRSASSSSFRMSLEIRNALSARPGSPSDHHRRRCDRTPRLRHPQVGVSLVPQAGGRLPDGTVQGAGPAPDLDPPEPPAGLHLLDRAARRDRSVRMHLDGGTVPSTAPGSLPVIEVRVCLLRPCPGRRQDSVPFRAPGQDVPGPVVHRQADDVPTFVHFFPQPFHGVLERGDRGRVPSILRDAIRCVPPELPDQIRVPRDPSRPPLPVVAVVLHDTAILRAWAFSAAPATSMTICARARRRWSSMVSRRYPSTPCATRPVRTSGNTMLHSVWRIGASRARRHCAGGRDRAEGSRSRTMVPWRGYGVISISPPCPSIRPRATARARLRRSPDPSPSGP